MRTSIFRAIKISFLLPVYLSISSVQGNNALEYTFKSHSFKNDPTWDLSTKIWKCLLLLFDKTIPNSFAGSLTSLLFILLDIKECGSCYWSSKLITSPETSNFQYRYLCLSFPITEKATSEGAWDINTLSWFSQRWLTKIGVQIPQFPYSSRGMTHSLILYHFPKCPYGIKLLSPTAVTGFMRHPFGCLPFPSLLSCITFHSSLPSK